MRRRDTETIIPVLHDPVHGLTLYHVVRSADSGLALQSWMPNKQSSLDFEEEAREVRLTNRGAIAGNILGALTFLLGVALLLLTFRLAYDMFTVNPAVLFHVGGKTPLDLSQAVTTLMGVVVKILLLLVMLIICGAITNRGIRLYVDSRHPTKSVIIRESSPEPENKGRSKGREDDDIDRHSRTG